MFHCLRVKFIQKTRFGQEVGNFFFEMSILFNVVQQPAFLRAMNATLQTPITPWIVHIFLKIIQG
jgi:hypothetical protein